MSRTRLVLAFGALLCGATVASGQAPGPRECILALPDSARERTALYITADSVPGSVPLAQASVDLFTQEVAGQVRRLVTGDAGRVGPLGSPFGLFHLGHHVDVVAYRDGRMRRTIDAPLSLDTWSDRDESRSVARLLAAAVDSVHASGAAFVLPEGMDSLAFDLGLVWPQLGAHDTLALPTVRLAFPVATVVLPRYRPPTPLPPARAPNYPVSARQDNAEGAVILEFTVGADGLPVLETVKEVWPSERPRPTGREKSWYDQFLATATEAVSASRLTPAAYGHCPVPSRVQQPFVFSLRR